MNYSPLPTLSNLETEKYSLDILECDEGETIVAIDEVNRLSICELFKDGMGLREIYDEVENSNLQRKEIDKLLDNHFRTHPDSQSRVRSETGSLIENFL